MSNKPRREKGTGALYYDHARGLWRGVVDLGYKPTGKRDRRVVSSKSKATAQRKLRDLRKQVDTTGGAPLHRTVESWLTEWLTDIAAPRVRPRTLATYRGYVNNWLIPSIGRRRLDQLQPQHVRGVYKTMEAGGLSSTSALQAHRILVKALTDAQRDGLVMRNVAELVDAPTKAANTREGLELADALTMLRHLAGPPAQPLASRWAAALFTGARQGELLGLEVDRVHIDPDTDTGWLDISWQLQRLPSGEAIPSWFEHRRVRGGLYLTRPKTKAGTRVVPLAPPLAAILRRHLATTPPNEYGLVWTTEKGNPIDPRKDWQAWQDALAAAGLRPGPLHAARNTTATLLMEAEVDAHVIQAIIGHASIVTTRGYQKVRQPLAEDAMRRLGNLLALD